MQLTYVEEITWAKKNTGAILPIQVMYLIIWPTK
jgi:hypothetical protein